ncbi:MAG: hypothetical protein AAF741_04910 [Bacteroidota bacterium]
MRILLLLLCAIAFVSLLAQAEEPSMRFNSEKGYWQINVGYFLPVNTKFPFERYTTDTIGLPPLRFGRRPNRVIETDGEVYEYYNRPFTQASATDPSNWWAYKIGVRLTFNYGLSLRFELFRANAIYASIPENLDALLGPNDGYRATRDTLSARGHQIGIDYTFFRNRRLQVQTGFSVRFSTVLQSFSQPIFIVPDLNYEESIMVPNQLFSRRFRDNDLSLQVNVLYRLVPSLSVGLEFWRQLDDSNQLGGSFIGLNLRYWLPGEKLSL